MHNGFAQVPWRQELKLRRRSNQYYTWDHLGIIGTYTKDARSSGVDSLKDGDRQRYQLWLAGLWVHPLFVSFVLVNKVVGFYCPYLEQSIAMTLLSSADVSWMTARVSNLVPGT